MARINVRLTPRAGRNAIDGWRERVPGTERVLHVRVAAAPVDGEANDALMRLLAKAIGVAPSAVAIVSGTTSRDKLVEIHGVSAPEVASKIEAAQSRTAEHR